MQAPDFTIKDQFGQPVTLSAFRGTNVLLVFFPLAFTAVCQGELSEIRDHPARYRTDDTVTLTVSASPPPVHRVWAEQNGFDFPVLSDFWPHGAVACSYGVFDAGSGLPNRGTFAVDGAGTIAFAEMKQPGERRDQTAWTDALAALRAI